MAEGFYGCLASIHIKECRKKSAVHTNSENTCVCVILTHVDRMNTVFLITESWWRQAVRLKPRGADYRCCQPSASNPRDNKTGCLLTSALEGKGNIYKGETIPSEFLIINQLFHRAFVRWVQFEFTVCCQLRGWSDLTIAVIRLKSE